MKVWRYVDFKGFVKKTHNVCDRNMTFMTTKEKNYKLWIVEFSNPVGIYLFKVNKINTKIREEPCSKLALKTREWRQWRCFFHCHFVFFWCPRFGLRKWVWLYHWFVIAFREIWLRMWLQKFRTILIIFFTLTNIYIYMDSSLSDDKSLSSDNSGFKNGLSRSRIFLLL